MATRIILEKNVEIPLRDGTVTRANVYRPEADAPVPAILVRTPYSKDLLFAQTFSLDPVRSCCPLFLAKVRRRSEVAPCLLDPSASKKRP